MVQHGEARTAGWLAGWRKAEKSLLVTRAVCLLASLLACWLAPCVRAGRDEDGLYSLVLALEQSVQKAKRKDYTLGITSDTAFAIATAIGREKPISLQSVCCFINDVMLYSFAILH